MAALSITPTSVVAVSPGGCKENHGVAGATITAGQALYLDTNSKLQPAANDTAAHALVVGIAMNGGAINQKITYAQPDGGLIDLGATIVVGMAYCVGTAGGIIPVSDLATGNFGTFLGWGVSANRLKFVFSTSGVAAAADVT